MNTPDTTRFRLTVHYDGTAFHGWQVQPDHPTVQGAIEQVLLRITEAPRRVIGSGRTDTGVHATGQVASVDLPSKWTAPELRKSLNALLPRGIWIEQVVETDPGFHPRFDARRRSYLYRIGTEPAANSPRHRRFCWPLEAELDLEAMERAASVLPGEHSFAAFAKAGQPHLGEICTVHEVGWTRWECGIGFTVTANRFLHHMVRYLVGTLVDIGVGRRPESEIARMLDGGPDTPVTSPPAPPEGLFLTRVRYEDSL